MRVPQYLAEDELTQRTLEVLMRALGPIETMRFLNLPRAHRLESVERHRQWQESLDQEKFFDEVFGPVESTSVPNP